MSEFKNCSTPESLSPNAGMRIGSSLIPFGSISFRRALRSAVLLHARTLNQAMQPAGAFARRSELSRPQVASALALYAVYSCYVSRCPLDIFVAQVQALDDAAAGDLPSWIETTQWMKQDVGANVAKSEARRLRLEFLSSSVDGRTLSQIIATFADLAGERYQEPAPVDEQIAKQPRERTVRTIQSPVPWARTDPLLVLAEEGTQGFFGMESLHPSELGNTLILGGTGSGKTVSVVVPILKGLLRYQLHDGRKASVLVIDPKRELEAATREILRVAGEPADRLVIIGECPPIRFFEHDSPLSPSERLAKLEALVPGMQTGNQGSHIYWQNLGMSFLRALFDIAQAVLQRTGDSLFEQMRVRLRLRSHAEEDQWAQVQQILTYTRTGHRNLKYAEQAIQGICDTANFRGPSRNFLTNYTGSEDLLAQWNYGLMSVESMVAFLASDDVSAFVDCSVLPDPLTIRTDVSELMASGKVVLFSPEMRQGHDIAAMALKTRWYQSVYSRADLHRPIGIVVDEAQRFLTSDPETGEQDFLDRCRAYRCLTVLASQSMASLMHRFGSDNQAETSIAIISANTPSKFVLRSTDEATADRLRALIPPAPSGGKHVVTARPPSSLSPGEAYFSLADGRWGRGRAVLPSID